MREKTKMHEQPRHEQQSRLSRRRLIGGALGAIASGVLAPRSAIAPERGVIPSSEEQVSQIEIDALEANLYDTAEKYGLSLAPKDDIREALHELGGAQSESEAISIVSAFTERQFGFTVNDVSYGENNQNTVSRYERLVGHLSLLPKEVYEAINLEKIDIGIPFLNSPGRTDIQASFTFAALEDRSVITILPSSSDSLGLLLHEVSHGLDYTSLLGSGSEEERQAAGRYLSEGRGSEAEDAADVSAAWMMGDDRRADRASEQLTPLLDRYNALVPGIVPYVEEALQPYLQNLTYSEKGYPFQPVE